MSEIKFRAWCKQYGDPGFMVYPGDYNDEFITFDGKPIEIKVSQYEYEADELKYELMQYTGLKDKKGKEIYEGDIIKIGDYLPYEVIVNNFSKVHCIDNELGQEELFKYHKSCKVIGNIFESPELMVENQ
ncbi:YopX family protein [Haladaptatus sp. AB643]|nr:YopX family protein [Haladaptatus sp. AB643]